MSNFDDQYAPGVLLTTAEAVVGWLRKTSFWPLTMGLACCAIEMISYGGPRHDAARWGHEVFRASPRQADLMIVSGRVSHKMAPVVRRLYDQMSNPKNVIAMGACASTGGIFNNYAIVQGVDHIVPVDYYMPGCPPNPDQMIECIMKLRQDIFDNPMGKHKKHLQLKKEKEALEAPSLLEMKGLMR